MRIYGQCPARSNRSEAVRSQPSGAPAQSPLALLAKIQRSAMTFMGLLSLAGVMVGPNSFRPKLVVPARYKEAAGWVPADPADGIKKGQWSTAFGDRIWTSWSRWYP